MGDRRALSPLPSRRFPPEAFLIFLTMLPVTGVVPILKPFVMDGFGASELATHVFLAFNMVAAFLFAPFVGAIADRFAHPRQLIVLASLVDGAFFVAMPHVDSYAFLMTLRFFEGVAHISVLSQLLAMASARESSAGRSPMGLVGATLTFGVALGSPLGGMLGEHSTTLALSVGGGIMILSALLAQITLAADPVSTARPGLREILQTLVAQRELRLPYLFAFLDRFTVGFFVASFPIFAASQLGFSSGRIGLLIAAFMLTMGILCYPTVKLFKRFPVRGLLLTGSFFYGLFFTGIGWIPESLLIFWMILIGAASAVMFIPTLQLTARCAPAYARTAVMGGFTSAGSLGFLAGPIVSGLLYTSFSSLLEPSLAYALVFTIGGGIEVVAVLLVLALSRVRGSDPVFP